MMCDTTQSYLWCEIQEAFKASQITKAQCKDISLSFFSEEGIFTPKVEFLEKLKPWTLVQLWYTIPNL